MKHCQSSKATNIRYLKLSCSTATTLVQTAVTVLVLERRTAGWNSACIGKVLRPAKSSSSKYLTRTKHPRCTTRLSCSPPENNFKISNPKTALPNLSKICRNAALKTQIQQNSELSPNVQLLMSVAFFNIILPITLASLAAKRSILSWAYLYQKDKRVPPGNQITVNFLFSFV